MSTPRSAERAPDKSPDAFRTISEVAEELGLPQHVLRFWETRFSQIRPLKRGGGRRYYRPDDVDLVKGIRHLLYGEGYTIRGVQRILKDEGPRFVQAIGRGEQQVAAPPEGRVELDREDSLGASLSSYGGTAQDSGVEDSNAFMSREDAPATMMSPDPSRSYIADADLNRLRDALAELAECVRVLDGLKLPNEPLAGE